MATLTRKLGPLPLWAWGGLAAAAVWFFFLRGGGQSSSTPGGSAAGASATPGPDSVYGLGFAQGQQAAQAQATPVAATATSATVAPTATWSFGPPPAGASIVWRATDSGKQAFVKATGGQWPGGVGVGMPDPSTNAALGNFGWQWAQVPSGTDPGTYAQQLSGAGMGGPSTSRPFAIGSRSAWLWHDAHPGIGARVHYAHYVQAVGGPGNHQREIHRVAHQSGVHPARIMMLNPNPARANGRIRVA